MSHSLGEIEALCVKAAKGAGLTWGEAEEAGQAVRILAASSLPAVQVFAQYLTSLETNETTKETCPVRLGCKLVDGTPLGQTLSCFPLILAGFLARKAASDASALRLEAAEFSATVSPDLSVVAENALCRKANVHVVSAESAPTLKRVYRTSASQDDLAVLEALAHRTYAPETEERKRAGAGAGDDGNS